FRLVRQGDSSLLPGIAPGSDGTLYRVTVLARQGQVSTLLEAGYAQQQGAAAMTASGVGPQGFRRVAWRQLQRISDGGRGSAGSRAGGGCWASPYWGVVPCRPIRSTCARPGAPKGRVSCWGMRGGWGGTTCAMGATMRVRCRS